MNPVAYAPMELGWIGLSVFLLGMAKGGVPVGTVALPILILIWPVEHQAGRAAVAFVLPLLCIMDIFAIAFFRKYILWKHIRPLLPSTLLGVVVASMLFVSSEQALLAVSDRTLKTCIGVLGLLFVAYQAMRRWILHRLAEAALPPGLQHILFGIGAGLTSTLAHAAAPLMQMYLLPKRLDRLNFAGTMAGFFFLLNLIKLLPFAALGRFNMPDLALGLMLVPLIPLGVATGFLIVRSCKTRVYIGFIYTILFVTSVTLLIKAWS